MLGRRMHAAIIAAVVVLALPAGASAASITFSGDVLTYEGGSVANNSSFTAYPAGDPGCGFREGACMDVQEAAGTITVLTDRCTDEGFFGTAVECDLPASVVVNAGDGEDSVFAADVPTTINGGGGNDISLKGGAAGDTVNGGPGNDSIFGMAGDDTIDGGDGDDLIEGFGGLSAFEPGATVGRDVYIGGPGKDFVEYAGRTEPLAISLNDVADDGAPGEGDNVRADVEQVRGGESADTMVGNDGPNSLDGWTGNDSVHGGGGDDFLFGKTGADTVLGEGGQDTIEGGEGDDQVDGGDAPDILYGDELQTCIPAKCQSGRDTIRARDGVADEVYCGPGQDSAVVDGVDTVAGDTQDACEAVDRGPDVTDTTPPALRSVKIGKLDLSRGATTIRLRLAEDATLAMRVERQVRRNGRNRWKKVKGRLSATGVAGANRLRFDGRVGGKRLKPGRHRFVIVATDAAGNRARPKRVAFKVVR